MNGFKFKLAHKRAEKDKWSTGDKTQRNHLIKILQDFIKELKEESIEEFVAGELSPKKTKTPKETQSKKEKKILKPKREMEEA
jgi:hypothetical protein